MTHLAVSKVNEAKIGEDRDDTKPISECTLDEQEMRRGCTCLFDLVASGSVAKRSVSPL
ncbi:hypothetical protein T4C_7184 [Trichinella pseudospiralis]|uniref:Uncharacterized protein n=1 Tax=Trichinella pseudospiralis TaxID=6337 RepID=A0A0V1IX74_TRIPS|nr:hypothetical protein T4C_7184 [Trichinella pseudospiralis]